MLMRVYIHTHTHTHTQKFATLTRDTCRIFSQAGDHQADINGAADLLNNNNDNNNNTNIITPAVYIPDHHSTYLFNPVSGVLKRFCNVDVGTLRNVDGDEGVCVCVSVCVCIYMCVCVYVYLYMCVL